MKRDAQPTRADWWAAEVAADEEIGSVAKAVLCRATTEFVVLLKKREGSASQRRIGSS